MKDPALWLYKVYGYCFSQPSERQEKMSETARRWHAEELSSFAAAAR